MVKVKVENSSSTQKKIRRALTPEARENQLIALATDLVEQRLLNGTASSQETTHFLKLATSKTRLEKEKLELENELVRAKTEAIKSQKNSEELYEKALRALGIYSGKDMTEDDQWED